jgi:hypothetical protein
LSDANVEALHLKGRALALRLYGNPDLRPSSDVDLFVRENDVSRALLALNDCGFRPAEAETRASPHGFFSRLFDLRYEHHVSLEAPKGMAPVELHFRLLSGIGRHIDGDAAFSRALDFRLDGRLIRVLSPADEFAYLVAHAAHHNFTPLLMLEDLRRLAASFTPADFKIVGERARQWGLEVALAVAFDLLERWMGMRIGHDVLSWQARCRAFALRPAVGDIALTTNFYPTRYDAGRLLNLAMRDHLASELVKPALRRLMRGL